MCVLLFCFPFQDELTIQTVNSGLRMAAAHSYEVSIDLLDYSMTMYETENILLIIIFKIGWVGLIKCINTVIKLIAVIFNFVFFFMFLKILYTESEKINGCG